MKTGVLELNKTLLDQSLKRSSQREAVEQKRTSENLSALTNVATSLAAQAIAPKADGLAELNKDYAKATKKLYKKISSTDYDTGFEGLDKKQDVFMNGVIKDYYSIKTNMNNQVDPSLAMQDLAKAENMIDEYGTGVANMIGFNKAIEEASKADLNSGGKLSNAGAPSSQLQIIRKVSGGGKEAEDIEIKREGNNIILYDIKTDTSLNITEFNAAQSRNEEYLVYAKPTEDFTTERFGDRIKNENDEDVYNTNFVTKNSDNTYSMTLQQQIDYKNGSMGIEVDSNGKELMSMGGDFEGLLFGGENIAESIWEDQMFEDPNFKVESQWPTGDQEIAIPFGDKFIKTELSSDEIINNAKKANATKEDKELYEAFYKTYYKPSLNFLAEQSLKNGSSSMQITLDQPPEENKVTTPGAEAPANTVVQTSKAVVVEEGEEEAKIVYGAKGFNTEPTEEQAENLKKAAQEPKTEDGFIKANQIFEENAGINDNGKLAATPQTKEDLKRYFYTEDTIPNTNYSDGNQKYGTKKLFPTGKPNTAAYDMAAMINMNSAWDPRIIAAIASGEIKPDERGDYLFGRNDKELQKSIDLSNVDPQKMLNEMTDLYKNTYAKSENSSEMKKDKQLPEQYASYIERIKFIADRYGLELPKGYNEFGRPEEEEEEESNEVVVDTNLNDEANEIFDVVQEDLNIT